MTRHLHFILGDQLTRSLSALRDIDPVQDIVLMVEAAAEARNVPHHKQKIAFVLSAMRHFADGLRAGGLRVDYVQMDDPENEQDLRRELAKAVRRHRPGSIIVTEPSEWRVWQMMQDWNVGAPLDIREDDRFFLLTGRFCCPHRGSQDGPDGVFLPRDAPSHRSFDAGGRARGRAMEL